jgi:hypothetical protein
VGSTQRLHPAGPARTTPARTVRGRGAGAEPGGALQGRGSTLAVYQDLHLTPVSTLRQRLTCRVDEAPDRDRPAPGGPQGNDRSGPAGMGAVRELRLD